MSDRSLKILLIIVGVVIILLVLGAILHYRAGLREVYGSYRKLLDRRRKRISAGLSIEN